MIQIFKSLIMDNLDKDAIVVIGDADGKIELSSRVKEEPAKPSPTAAGPGCNLIKFQGRVTMRVVRSRVRLSSLRIRSYIPLYLIYALILIATTPTLMAYVLLTYQIGVFKTHPLLANMAVITYVIAITTSMALLMLKSSTTPIFFMILRGVFFFTGLLVPLSLVLLVCLPSRM